MKHLLNAIKDGHKMTVFLNKEDQIAIRTEHPEKGVSGMGIHIDKSNIDDLSEDFSEALSCLDGLMKRKEY